MNRLILLIIYGIALVEVAVAQSYAPVWGDRKIKVTSLAGIKAYAFPLSDVKLLPGPFLTAMEADVNYLLKIDPDRLLADFRAHSGLEPKASKYGGWESSGLAGHTLGHYLSALVLHHAHTKNAEFLKRANYIIDELEICQLARKSGYVGAIPNEDSMWREVSRGNIRSRGFDLNGAWSPWYTVHKIMSGLLDAYIYIDSHKALKINNGIADWAGHLVQGLNDSLMQKMLGTEYGGMNDALVNTYAFTGNKKYLDLSYRFHDRRILDSLAMGRDILPGKHSNTQIPKVIGTARRYQLTANTKDIATAEFFWKTVTEHHSFATGGNSNYEYLGDPGVLSEKLSDNTTETCNTYNMLKLTRMLYALKPSASLIDYYEKALYNHILASQHHGTGMVTYFVPLRMGGKKNYSTEFDDFTCCVGTGMENHVKYGENIYHRGSDGSLYINLFIASQLNWNERSLRISQQFDNATGFGSFRITTQKPATLTIRIRKPRWANDVSLLVNGALIKTVPDNSGYLVLTRTWKNNDQIELRIPPHFYTESMPDNKNRQALFYGPLLLAGILGDKEPEPDDIPVLVSNETDINKWVRLTDTSKLLFATAGVAVPTQVKMIAFNATKDEHYSVYWDVFTPAEWVVQQKKYEAEKRKQKALEDRTVDYLRLGEMQPERDHDFVITDGATGETRGRKWRSAGPDGSFNFKMKVDPTTTNTIVCTYWGMDNRGRVFDIMVDDQKVATEDLLKFRMSKFYEVGYAVPTSLTRSKTHVTVQFIPQKKNTAGPVYGVRMARGDVQDLITPLTNESIYR